MNENAFHYQFLLALNNLSRRQILPNALKEILKQLDISDYQKLERTLTFELQNAALATEQNLNYYLLIAKQSLLYCLLRRDTQGFKEVVNLIRHRRLSLKNIQHDSMNHNGWEAYLELIFISFDRQIRKTSIDNFEQHISSIDWQIFDADFIPAISLLIGYVYLQEKEKKQQSKSKIWLDKALTESQTEQKLSIYFFLIAFTLQQERADTPDKLKRLIHQLADIRDSLDSPVGQKIYDYAIYEQETLIVNGTFLKSYDNQLQLEDRRQVLREVESQFHQVEASLPSFTKAIIQSHIGSIYGQLFDLTSEGLEKESFSKHAADKFNIAIRLTEEKKDGISSMYYRLQKSEAGLETCQRLNENDLREIVDFYKKNLDFPLYLRASRSYIKQIKVDGNPQKSYLLISGILKQGIKRIEKGGIHLINCGFALANEMFLLECKEPGISWMVDILDTFFAKIKEIMDDLENYFTFISKSQVEDFLKHYADFEPISHFSIRTYFSYQFYQLKGLRLSALINKNQVSLKLGEQLIKEFENKNNPLSFIKADWEEEGFKDVPNSVRNKTINKAINISRGVLPKAAEHLQFSYRNLRSYITFKEVNRLGFFLNMQETSNKQLELGIRYMFYDLYKSGTIFDVVFDMPKFLVENAQEGFFARNLEKELNIKATTAKKYIKIMINREIICEERSKSPKHFYRLNREKVMSRLGMEQSRQ